MKYLILFSLQESTRINHSTVRCVMSAWTNALKENTSVDLILDTMNAVSA